MHKAHSSVLVIYVNTALSANQFTFHFSDPVASGLIEQHVFHGGRGGNGGIGSWHEQKPGQIAHIAAALGIYIEICSSCGLGGEEIRQELRSSAIQ